MSKRHIRYFCMGPFDVAHFGFTQNSDAFAKEMKRMKIEEEIPFVPEGFNAAMHYFERGREWAYIIAMPQNESVNDIQIAALLAHEVVHAKQRFFKAIGEKRIGIETEAYFVQTLLQGCLEVVEMNKTRKVLL